MWQSCEKSRQLEPGISNISCILCSHWLTLQSLALELREVYLRTGPLFIPEPFYTRRLSLELQSKAWRVNRSLYGCLFEHLSTLRPVTEAAINESKGYSWFTEGYLGNWSLEYPLAGWITDIGNQFLCRRPSVLLNTLLRKNFRHLTKSASTQHHFVANGWFLGDVSGSGCLGNPVTYLIPGYVNPVLLSGASSIARLDIFRSWDNFFHSKSPNVINTLWFLNIKFNKENFCFFI